MHDDKNRTTGNGVSQPQAPREHEPNFILTRSHYTQQTRGDIRINFQVDPVLFGTLNTYLSA